MIYFEFFGGGVFCNFDLFLPITAFVEVKHGRLKMKTFSRHPTFVQKWE